MKTPEKQLAQHNLPTPLVADPRRQASGLFKGLDFQIWLTVSAWVRLQDDQLLVVEGVEDFDIVEQGSGITTQVKALSEPISLRSPCVVEAVRNYWQNSHRNNGFRLEYRFVTTGEVAVEQGEPFGPKKAGLSVWTEASAAAQETHSEALRQFLLKDHSVGPRLAAAFPPGVPSLQDFLATASTELLFEQFLRPIRWWTRRRS